MENVFVAKVSGEYIAQRGRDRVLKSYEAKFRLPNAQTPLAMIRGKLLVPFLRKLDANFIAPYSWHLVELAREKGKTNVDEIPVMFQSFAQLTEYCAKHRIQVPIEEYADLEMCRAHVQVAQDDPIAFQKLYAKYKDRIDEDRALRELNDNFENIGEQKGEVQIDGETGAVLPKSAPSTGTPAPEAPLTTAIDDADDEVKDMLM